jgi:FAD-linked oxidoreductase
MAEWRNWSGSVTARPSGIVRPTSEEALARVVRQARRVRVAGAGHSFWPLCETDGVLLSLDDLPGAIEVAADRDSAWVPAGWSIERVTRTLWDEGLALANQGDIDRQAVAGALATGTHGTGADLPCLSATARRVRLMLADGSVVVCGPGEHDDLFQGQRLSLGLMGVAVAVELAVVPAYHLEERIEKRPLDEVYECFEGWAETHRHAEFWILPYADTAIVKRLHPAEDDGTFTEPPPVDETVFRLACELSAASARFTAPLQQTMARGSGRSRRVGPAHRIFPSERTIPFEEMEYEVPRADGLAVLREIIDWVRKGDRPVTFPFELRWTAADDIWLSPFQAGPSASISMHQFAGMPWHDLFAEAEVVFRAAAGRPHWAKRHTLRRDDVDALYPMAERFRQVRRTYDPEGTFLNDPLEELFS